ncbi:MAG: hypothetical protein K2F76_01740, partial [Duncaniella dubosii]|nr:hypothetical protein [Duncaniella dubosii]
MSLTRIIRLFIIIMLLPVVSHAETDREFVVMIDPGHGGKDAGALGRRPWPGDGGRPIAGGGRGGGRH